MVETSNDFWRVLRDGPREITVIEYLGPPTMWTADQHRFQLMESLQGLLNGHSGVACIRTQNSPETESGVVLMAMLNNFFASVAWLQPIGEGGGYKVIHATPTVKPGWQLGSFIVP